MIKIKYYEENITGKKKMIRSSAKILGDKRIF